RASRRDAGHATLPHGRSDSQRQRLFRCLSRQRMSPLCGRDVHARHPKQAPMHSLLRMTCVAGATVALGCTRVEVPADDDATEVLGTQSSAITGVNLVGSNLAGVNLAGTNLAGTNLGGPNLGGTNLAGTNLAGTNLAGTNFGGNNLAGTNMAS